MNQIFEDQGTLNVRALVVELWQRRWWIVITLVLFTAGFATAAFKIEPTYRALTVLVPAESQSLGGSLGSAFGQIGGLAALAGVSLGGGDAHTDEALAVLRSREFIERFVTDLGLLQKLFPENWDAAIGRWKPGRQPTLATAYKRILKISDVEQDKKTSLVKVRLDWSDPQEAATWLNAMIQRLNAEMRVRAIAKAEASVKFLEKELESTTQVGTRDAINRLIEAQVRQRMLASVSEESAFRVVDKAMAPDRTDPIKPNKLLLLIVGPFVGGIMGVLVVLMFNWVRSALTFGAQPFAPGRSQSQL